MEIESAIRQYVVIGASRTLEQDFEFGVAQTLEIALRALSPAINDTFTAIACIDWLGEELRQFAQVPVWHGAWRDGQGIVRLLEPTLEFHRVVKAAFAPVRQAAQGNVAVLIRLLQSCERLAPLLQSAEQRHAILEQAEAIRQTASQGPLISSDRADIDAAFEEAQQALNSRAI
jgi:uncharacterized membrane protein